MKKLLRTITVFLLCLHSLNLMGQTSRLAGQNSRRESYWTIGIQLNAFNYFGDITPAESFASTDISFTRPNFGIEVTRKISPRLSIRGSFNYGRLQADDSQSADLSSSKIARYGRNLHFRNDIYELACIATYELFPSRGRFYRRRYMTPYIFAGIAVFHHNPKAKVPLDYTGPGAKPGEWVALRPLHTEGEGLRPLEANSFSYGKEYSLIQPAIPVGAGMRFRLGDRLDLSFEMGFRILFFDYLDDVSRVYPNINDFSQLPSPQKELAMAMYDRSAEPVAALTGKSRDIAAVTAVAGQLTNYYGTLPSGEGNYLTDHQRVTSYGLAGDKRGTQKQNDLYLVTGFHINYILTTKRFPRYPRRNF